MSIFDHENFDEILDAIVNDKPMSGFVNHNPMMILVDDSDDYEISEAA